MAGSIVGETATRIFADLADPQTVNRAADDAWKSALWRTLAEAGLTVAWVPEEQGGAGASLAEGFEILTVAGRFAAPVPLAETLLAGWLLAQADMSVPAGANGAMTVVPARPADRIALGSDGALSGRARGVPFASEAAHLVVLASGQSGPSIALVERSAVRIERGESLAGDASDTVTLDRAVPIAAAPAPVGIDRDALMLMGAVIRSVETAGALETMLALSLRYAEERVAFERPIAKFQAVQHNLARLAGEVAAALTAAGSAADAIASAESFDEAIFLEAASAKIRSAEAAQEGAAIAHQVHGAIGFTREHVLHRFTLRVLGWRDDFGNESHWAVELGKRVAARGADAFWPLLASR
ncbi:MAG TPA: acyl-CoA dehydrogenase family protein [Xanthobacteraceae bacterium]